MRERAQDTGEASDGKSDPDAVLGANRRRREKRVDLQIWKKECFSALTLNDLKLALAFTLKINVYETCMKQVRERQLGQFQSSGETCNSGFISLFMPAAMAIPRHTSCAHSFAGGREIQITSPERRSSIHHAPISLQAAKG